MKKTAIATAMMLALGAGVGVAQAAPVTTTNVFVMYDGTGALFNTDPTTTGVWNTDPAVMTWNVASTTTFSGFIWTAHDGVLYNPGTYTVSTADVVGNTCGASFSICASGPDVVFTVPTGMIGGVIKFAWGATDGIDVFNIWNSAGVSQDVEGDGIPGMKMVDGPFAGFSANFSMSPSPAVVPVPAAVWLFGSGLLGLVGVARRKKVA